MIVPNILYEDNSIIIVEKPAGIATQSADVTRPDLVSLIKNHLGKTDPYVGVIHRLDQPVAGILVFAKDKKTAAALSKQVRSDVMNKHYRALVEGIVDVQKDAVLVDKLYKDSRQNKAVISDTAPSGVSLQEAKLFYRTEKIYEDRGITELSIRLVTGRFHQIRAQLSHMNHPIVGDRKYGSTMSYQKGIALVADRLEFTHPLSGEKVEKVVDFSFSL